MGLLDFLSIFKNKSDSLPKTSSTTCCLCTQPLSGKVLQDTWNNRAHLHHKITFCSSCDRILSKYSSAGAYRYSDGRMICGLCKKISITDSVSANRSRRKVQEQLEAVGFRDIPKGLKVVLSHAHALSAHSHKSHTAGLTLTHFHFEKHRRTGISHQIGILSGLPRVEFEAVLAHEMLHVWQHENGVKFSPMYREGLCELGGYLIYTEDDSDLSRHFIQKMMNNKDPIYGNGFRLMHKKLEQWGWQGLIREVLKNKRGWEASLLKKIFSK